MDLLLNGATDARLFHASDGAGFADLIIDGHRETWPLRSKRFQTWLRQQPMSGPGMRRALPRSTRPSMCWRQAQFDGPQRKVSVRIAEHDGLIYLDLADDSGVASKSAPTDGGSPRTLRSGSAAAPACSRFHSRCGADQLIRSRPF
jgi:hypothetical protein